MDPRPRWFTKEFWMNLHSRLWKSSTPCSPILTPPSPCRTFWSDKDTTSSSDALLLAQTSGLCQRLLQIMYHLFPHQTCAPQTLQTPQTASNSGEALEFHLHRFHREAPFIFQLYLDPSHCRLPLKAVTL